MFAGDSQIYWTWYISNFYGWWLLVRVLQYFPIQISTIQKRWRFLTKNYLKFRNFIWHGSFCKKIKQSNVIDYRHRIEKKFRPLHNLKCQFRRLLVYWCLNEIKLGPWWILFWNRRMVFVDQSLIGEKKLPMRSRKLRISDFFSKRFIKINAI